MYYKKLIGKNIYLAPKTIEDAEKYAEWLNDFRTTDYLGKSGKIMTLEKEREYLETHIDDERKRCISWCRRWRSEEHTSELQSRE